LNSFPVAAMQYEEALALWPDDDTRPELLYRHALALLWYDEDRQQEALEGARDALLAVGDIDRTSEAEVFIARLYWNRGVHDLVREHLARAEALAGSSASMASARVFAFSARIREIAGEIEEARRLAETALTIAEQLGLDELRAHALTTIGMTKNDSSDPSGIADMERALEIAIAADSPVAASVVNNLAVAATFAGDFPRTDELYSEALRLAERFGDGPTVRFVRGNQIWIDFHLGRWDRAYDAATAFIDACETGSPHMMESSVRQTRAALFEARGDHVRARADMARSLELARLRNDPWDLTGALSVAAAMHAQLGQFDEALPLAAEISTLVWTVGAHGALTRVAPFADELGIADGLREALAAEVGTALPFWRRMIELTLAGELSAAADVIRSAGNPTMEAYLRRHAGIRLLAEGRTDDATIELERALAFYREVGATYFVEDAENRLAEAQRASA
jgi:tetratricopeptide (TPR) repeat protein